MPNEIGVPGARITPSARKWASPFGVARFVAYRPEDPGTSVETVREAVRAANRRSEERAGDEAARGDVVVAVGQEVHLRLAVGGEPPTREAWLQDLAAALPGGELTRPKNDVGPEPALAELLTLHTVTAFLGQRPEGDADRLITALLKGMPAEAGAYFGAGEAGMEVDQADLPYLFHAIESATEVLFVDDGRVRGNIAVAGPAASRYECGTTWQEELASAHAALERTAPQLDVGFVRRTPAYTSWADVHLYPPHWPSGREGLRYKRDAWWSRRLPDAHGLQLVTIDHLDRATDLSAWEITPVGDRYLLAARDPEPWFADDQPDPTMLERARRDFGAMIATEAELDPRN